MGKITMEYYISWTKGGYGCTAHLSRWAWTSPSTSRWAAQNPFNTIRPMTNRRSTSGRPHRGAKTIESLLGNERRLTSSSQGWSSDTPIPTSNRPTGQKSTTGNLTFEKLSWDEESNTCEAITLHLQQQQVNKQNKPLATCTLGGPTSTHLKATSCLFYRYNV